MGVCNSSLACFTVRTRGAWLGGGRGVAAGPVSSTQLGGGERLAQRAQCATHAGADVSVAPHAVGADKNACTHV